MIMSTKDKEVNEKSNILIANKQKQPRKSFVPPKSTAANIQKVKPAVKSSIAFPTEEYRLAITMNYKKCGFTTLQAYMKALLDLSLSDNDVILKLINLNNNK
jgi:hypothetical protein